MSRADLRHWRLPALIAGALVIVICALYWQTAWSMVSIWIRSETYTHGFLIFPISAYMIWHNRAAAAELRPAPNYWMLLALAVLGVGWLLSDMAGVLVSAQYALVAAIPLLVAAVLGPRLVWTFAFPFAFLLLAVPFGEIFIPAMIDFTASFTVAALQLTGIPVFREGNFFTIPSGTWSVVDACSGLRYLIASFTLGCLYAYLTYRTMWRRLVFVLASLIVPIIANGLRAYMIVMIGHLSGMKYAVGVDHLIYGWLFFGVVMLLLFWIGSFWREDEAPAPTIKSTPTLQAANRNISLSKLLLAAFAALISFGIWPSLSAYLDHAARNPAPVAIALPESFSTWQASPEAISTWVPSVENAAKQASRVYQRDGKRVQVLVFYYRNQQSGRQMVSSQNVMASEKDKDWKNVGQSAFQVPLNPGLDVIQSRLHGPESYLLTWHWYWIGGEYLTNPYRAKWIQARAKLSSQGDDGAIIVLATPYAANARDAAETLRTFANDALPALSALLQQTRGAP
jgi:exosortase A